MLEFSGSAFTDGSFGENGEGFECLSWFFSSSAPSSVAIVKSSFLNYNVCEGFFWCFFVLFCFCSQTSDSPILFFSALLITTNYFSFFQLPRAAVSKEHDFLSKVPLYP